MFTLLEEDLVSKDRGVHLLTTVSWGFWQPDIDLIDPSVPAVLE